MQQKRKKDLIIDKWLMLRATDSSSVQSTEHQLPEVVKQCLLDLHVQYEAYSRTNGLTHLSLHDIGQPYVFKLAILSC